MLKFSSTVGLCFAAVLAPILLGLALERACDLRFDSVRVFVSSESWSSSWSWSWSLLTVCMGFCGLFSSLLHFMLPRKRAGEGTFVEGGGEEVNNGDSSASSGVSFLKKNRIGCFGPPELTATENSKSNARLGIGNSNSNTGNGSSSSTGEAPIMALGDSMPTDIDEDLHSRQLAVYGREAMRRLFALNVLVSGMQGLSAEIAKNLVLASVKSVTLHDEGVVELWDWSANFLFSENDVGGLSHTLRSHEAPVSLSVSASPSLPKSCSPEARASSSTDIGGPRDKLNHRKY